MSQEDDGALDIENGAETNIASKSKTVTKILRFVHRLFFHGILSGIISFTFSIPISMRLLLNIFSVPLFRPDSIFLNLKRANVVLCVSLTICLASFRRVSL